jgi:hypothetical protein
MEQTQGVQVRLSTRVRCLEQQLQAQPDQTIPRRRRCAADGEQALGVSRIRLAHRRLHVAADAPGGGNAIEALVTQVFVELRRRLLGVGVIAFVGDHVVARNGEASDPGRIRSVETRYRLPARGPDRLKRLDAARVAAMRPGVAAVADAESKADTLAGPRCEAGWLDPELMRHRRRRPRAERAGGEGGDGVAQTAHQGAESLLLFVPE